MPTHSPGDQRWAPAGTNSAGDRMYEWVIGASSEYATGDYSDMTKDELSALLESRDLPKSGKQGRADRASRRIRRGVKYVPDWYALILLALAAWRTFQLIALDDILDRPRRYVTRLGREWEKEGDRLPLGYRFRLGEFITCPYCAGFWISLVWWGLWLAFGDWTLVAATPWVLSAGVIAGHKLLASE